MSTKRKQYSNAVKAKIAIEAIKGEMTLADLEKKGAQAIHPLQKRLSVPDFT